MDGFSCGLGKVEKMDGDDAQETQRKRLQEILDGIGERCVQWHTCGKTADDVSTVCAAVTWAAASASVAMSIYQLM